MSKAEREPSATSPSDPSDDSMEALRRQIDALDTQLVTLLAERRHVVERITQVKREQDLPVSHPAREENLRHPQCNSSAVNDRRMVRVA